MLSAETLASRKQELLKREQRIGISVSLLDLLQQDRGQTPFQKPYVSLKTLYSDFVVRELSPYYNDGKPLQLEALPSKATVTQLVVQESAARDGQAKQMPSIAPLKRERPCLFDAAKQKEVREAFEPLLNQKDLQSLLVGLENESDVITLAHVTEKAKRTQVHHAVREAIGGGYISSTNNGAICVQKASEKDKREDRRRSNPIKTRAFLHFTLYKENFDSHQAIFFVSKQLNINKRQIQFCGTKDKRAVTLQRMAVQDVDPVRLCTVNERSCGAGHNVKLCSFQIRDRGLALGDALGNHFRIVLRLYPTSSPDGTGSEKWSAARVAEWQQLLQQNGVVNFFGPQRFGTTAVLTSDVGLCLLKGDFEGALYLIFLSKSMFVPALTEVLPLVKARDYTAALDKTPYYCSQERDMLKFLVDHDRDVFGAFCAMSRTMAMLYFHAVQSLVWNQMASARVALSRECLAGDLVLQRTYEERLERSTRGAALATPSWPYVVVAVEGGEDDKLPPVRVLTAADNLSLFSFADIVLPLPGPDRELQFPEASPCSRADYATALTQLGVASLLAPMEAAEEAAAARVSPQTKYSSALLKKFHFHGAYRPLGVRPTDLHLELLQVKGWATPVIPTDLQGLDSESRETEAVRPDGGGEHRHDEDITALVAEFSLSPGCYATSVLREISYAVNENFHSKETPQDEEEEGQI